MPEAQSLNVTGLIKGAERYVFLYRDTQLDQLATTLGRMASNPDLSLTWYDAAVLIQSARQYVEKRQNRTCTGR
jgi:hypothetical protein